MIIPSILSVNDWNFDMISLWYRYYKILYVFDERISQSWKIIAIIKNFAHFGTIILVSNVTNSYEQRHGIEKQTLDTISITS